MDQTHSVEASPEYQLGLAAGRLAGLREAAQVATDYANDHGEYPGLPQAGNSIAAAILALAEGKEAD